MRTEHHEREQDAQTDRAQDVIERDRKRQLEDDTQDPQRQRDPRESVEPPQPFSGAEH